MHDLLAGLSRLINRLRGGTPGKTLCWEEAMNRGYDCGFCRMVGRFLRQPTHCLEELSAAEIRAVKRRLQ